MSQRSFEERNFRALSPYLESANKIHLYNSLTGKREEFVPLDKDSSVPTVKMYVCGLTPYDSAHLGHAVAAIRYDVLRRYLEYRNLTVQHVTNVTDIDDKIIRRSQETGEDPFAMTERHTTEYFNSLAKLGVLTPTSIVKVTEQLEHIKEFVSRLVQTGFAYATEKGNVYFDVTKKEDYLKLSRQSLAALSPGERVEIENDKRHPADFALWKSDDSSILSTQSPWGMGRPGWHIECSAMIYSTLGEQIDIHGGGLDLKFPHHENELAQSEAFTGKPLARFWVYSGLLKIEGEKMSKSLGNLVFLKDAVETIGPELLKFALLRQSYRTDFDYTDKLFLDNLNQLVELTRFLEICDALSLAELVIENPKGEAKEVQDEFEQSMNSDLNTPEVLTAVVSRVKKLLPLIEERKDSEINTEVQTVCAQVSAVIRTLGLGECSPEAVYTKGLQYIASVMKVTPWSYGEVLAATSERAQARQHRDYQKADEVREKALEHGVELQDNRAGGCSWRFKYHSSESLCSK